VEGGPWVRCGGYRFVVCYQCSRVLGRHLEDDEMQDRQEGGVIVRGGRGVGHRSGGWLLSVFPAADTRMRPSVLMASSTASSSPSIYRAAGPCSGLWADT
jgi:hypothetical protein